MKFSRTLFRDACILLLTFGVMLWYFLFSGRVFHSHASNAENRDALIQIHRAIQLGSSASEVRELYRRHATSSLGLRDERPTDWEVRMPMEFGASDWKLLIEFQEGKVIRVRILTADGPPPKSGSADKEITSA
jgi:hypothetical protein